MTAAVQMVRVAAGCTGTVVVQTVRVVVQTVRVADQTAVGPAERVAAAGVGRKFAVAFEIVATLGIAVQRESG